LRWHFGEPKMIESLYIMDSSGLCLYSAPLAAKERYDPDLISGFMIAQQRSFKQLYGESTRILTLQKKQIILQNVDLKDRNMLIAIANDIGNPKEAKTTKTLLEFLVADLKNRKDRILKEPSSVVTDTIHHELELIVNKALKGVRCPFFAKGFLASKDQCERTSSSTDGRPCDFCYAVKECDRYNPRVTK
jgi:hypothetical protein